MIKQILIKQVLLTENETRQKFYFVLYKNEKNESFYAFFPFFDELVSFLSNVPILTDSVVNFDNLQDFIVQNLYTFDKFDKNFLEGKSKRDWTVKRKIPNGIQRSEYQKIRLKNVWL